MGCLSDTVVKESFNKNWHLNWYLKNENKPSHVNSIPETRIRALDFPRDEGRWKHTDNFMSWTFREARMIWIDEEENKGQ